MARLTIAKVRNAKPKAKPYRIVDGDGLALQVFPETEGGHCAKSWVFRYALRNPKVPKGQKGAYKDKVFTLGRFPEMSLADARKAVVDARQEARKGKDLTKEKVQRKAEQLADNENTLEAVCRDYLARRATKWSPGYLNQATRALELHVFPDLGALPVATLTSATVWAQLEQIKGPVVRQMVAQLLSQALARAVQRGRVSINVAAGLSRLVAEERPKPEGARALDEAEICDFLTKLDTFDAKKVWQPARRLLRLCLLLGLRGSEIRELRWADVDLENARIDIPAERMKKRRPHDSPLPRQAVEILEAQREFSGRSEFVFRSERGGKPLERSGLNNGLHGMGLKFSPHDLRATFRTRLVEMGYSTDTLMRQQAHSFGKVQDTYDQARKFEERAAMLQRWADALDRVRAGKPLQDNVIPLKPRKSRA